MSLVIAAQVFVTVLRQQVEPPEQAEKNANISRGSMGEFRLSRGLVSS
jgi:hypothetical protein